MNSSTFEGTVQYSGVASACLSCCIPIAESSDKRTEQSKYKQDELCALFNDILHAREHFNNEKAREATEKMISCIDQENGVSPYNRQHPSGLWGSLCRSPEVRPA